MNSSEVRAYIRSRGAVVMALGGGSVVSVLATVFEKAWADYWRAVQSGSAQEQEVAYYGLQTAQALLLNSVSGNMRRLHQIHRPNGTKGERDTPAE